MYKNILTRTAMNNISNSPTHKIISPHMKKIKINSCSDINIAREVANIPTNLSSKTDHILNEYKKKIINFIRDNENKKTDLFPKYESNEFTIDHHNLPQNEKDVINLLDDLAKIVNSKKFKQRNWSHAQLILLVWVTLAYINVNHILEENMRPEDWKKIANLSLFKNDDQCKYKYLSLKKINNTAEQWKKEEEEKLKEIIKDKFLDKIKWSEVAKELEKETGSSNFKSAKLCRERWNNYLNPLLKKGEWKIEEDCFLLNKIQEIGKKWSEIARMLPGRNEHSVKNRFGSLLRKQKKNMMKKKIKDKFSSIKKEEFFENEENLIKIIIKELEEKIKYSQNNLNNTRLSETDLLLKSQNKHNPNSTTNQIPSLDHINNLIQQRSHSYTETIHDLIPKPFQHMHHFSNMSNDYLANPFSFDPYKNFSIFPQQQNLPFFGRNSSGLIKFNTEGSLNDISNLIKETERIKIEKEPLICKEESKSYHGNDSNSIEKIEKLVLKNRNFNELNLKEENCIFKYAIINITKKEIFIYSSMSPSGTPLSSNDSYQYYRGLLSLNQSSDNLRFPSMDTIKSNESESKVIQGFKIMKMEHQLKNLSLKPNNIYEKRSE